MHAMAESGRFRLEFAYRRMRASFVARELEAARARGAGVLLVSTDLDEVASLATRAFALHAGRLLPSKSGRPDPAELGRLMLGQGAPA